MAEVTIENLTKSYHDKHGVEVTAVNAINLEIRDGEFMVLVGPSGCGKSTTLRMIAGLEEITAGRIVIDGKIINETLPKDRDIAMVFQNYALYPHMSVYDNMAFSLKLRGLPKDEIKVRVQEAADMLGISEYLERKPKALSGGQRQRVAVGRAIVRKPKVFLFDEPLSNLDAKMRVSMRTEISRLHARLGATMIYVTHDQVEAMTMADRICVMKGGSILQVAEPLALYNEPANLFVGGFIGSPPMNYFHGSIQRLDNQLFFIETNEHGTAIRLRLTERLAHKAAGHIGRRAVFGIRPENIHQELYGLDSPVSADVIVDLNEPMGSETYLHLNTGATSFIARVGAANRSAINDRVRVRFDLGQAHLFDADSGGSLIRVSSSSKQAGGIV